MQQDDINKSIDKRLDEVLPGKLAAKAVDLAIHNRPIGWSRKSNAPYYRELYAKQIKAEADDMIKTGSPKCYRYTMWCNDNTGMSRQTLYNRINQSIRYLIEQMDTNDHIYAKWYDSVNVCRDRDIGVVIKFK